MTINPNNTTAACSGSADRHPLLMPDVVLQEARELHRYWLKENKPYSAGVVADCIATIENLQGRPQASAPRSASAVGIDREKMAEIVYEGAHKGLRNCWKWTDAGLDDEHPGRRGYYYKIADAVLAALASNPLEGKGIQSITEQASSGVRSPDGGEG